MKRISLILLCLVFVLACLCACNTQTPADSTTEAPASDVQDPASTNANLTVYGKNDFTISKISELNTEEGELDSHATIALASSLEMNYREKTTLIPQDLAGAAVPFYPRIRKMPNGEYVMLYQHGLQSWEVFIAYSKDGIRWRDAKKLFATQPHLGGHNDTSLFMTADMIVTDEGTVVLACSFRGLNGYRDDVNSNGIVVMRSTDNARTWTQPEIVFTGTNWEPSLTQLESGEIHLYFTQVSHLIAIHGYPSQIINGNELVSSCVGLLRSTDGGVTWTKQDGYSAQIAAQEYIKQHPDGYPYMKAQMPSSVQLHNGTIALAYEIQDQNEAFKVSIAYSTDNFAKNLGFAEAGPGDIRSSIFVGGGPQIAQFRSGETMLAYHTGNAHYVLGDSNARTFGQAYDPFGNHLGMWATMCIDSDHSALASCGYITSGNFERASASLLDVARLYLNHQITAKKIAVTVDGKSDDWKDNTDAHFIGSETQAQASIRMAHDDENLYILVERLDENLYGDDSQSFMFTGADGNNFLVKLDAQGTLSCKTYIKGRPVDADIEGIEYHVSIVGSVDEKGGDEGAIFEIKIPKSRLSIGPDGVLLYNATLYNKDGANTTTDTFTGGSNTDSSTWQRVKLG